MTTGHVVYCDRNCNQLLLDWATTASTRYTGFPGLRYSAYVGSLASGKPRTLEWLLFCCPVTGEMWSQHAFCMLTGGSQFRSPIIAVGACLANKPCWDSLTDEQRDELLIVDLQSFHVKAASASGKSTLKLQPRGFHQTSSPCTRSLGCASFAILQQSLH